MPIIIDDDFEKGIIDLTKWTGTDVVGGGLSVVAINPYSGVYHLEAHADQGQSAEVIKNMTPVAQISKRLLVRTVLPMSDWTQMIFARIWGESRTEEHRMLSLLVDRRGTYPDQTPGAR